MREDQIVVMQDLSWADHPIAWPWWTAWLAGLLLAAIAAAAFYFFRKRLRTIAESVAPPIPAHITALEALRRLEASLSEENYLAFIIEVSRILRVYIQDRFRLRAPHRSTEEFLWEASESTLLVFGQQQLLAGFLGLCDKVKFARQQVALDRMKDLFETARRFVEETAERPQTLKPTPQAS